MADRMRRYFERMEYARDCHSARVVWESVSQTLHGGSSPMGSQANRLLG
jgi:hypothetical protein